MSLRAAVVVVLLFLVGCGNGEVETTGGRTPVRVSLLLLSTKQVDYYKWAERTYEERHPDTDIIIEQFPGVSLKDFEIKLRLGFSSGTAPEIFHAHENIIVEFATLGLLDEAPPYIEEMVQQNSLNERTRRAPYVDGACYGIVSDAVWTALYYNKDMFREAGLDPDDPPETWEELLDYAEKLTVRRPDGTIERAGLSLRKTGFKPGTAEKWLTFLYSAGGQPFTDDGTATAFNSEAGRAALGLYDAVLNERHIDSVTHDGDQPGFGQGRVAMFIREIHVVRWLRENYPDMDFGVAPIPAREASVSAGGTYMFVVNDEASDTEKAWRFIEFLMGDEAYGHYVDTVDGIMPAIRSIADRPKFRDDPIVSVFLKQEVGMPTPFPRVQRAMDILGAYIESFVYGRIDAEDMLERAQRDIDALMERNK